MHSAHHHGGRWLSKWVTLSNKERDSQSDSGPDTDLTTNMTGLFIFEFTWMFMMFPAKIIQKNG